MVKSGADRSAKYAAKFDADVARNRFAATATIAKEAQATLQEQLAVKAAAVRKILDSYGIYPILTVLYQSFNNKLFSICRKYTNTTARATALLEIAKWKDMGATDAALQDIWDLYADVLGAAPSPVP